MPRKYTVSEKVLNHMVEMRKCRRVRFPKAIKYISNTIRVPSNVYETLRVSQLPEESMWQTLCRTRIGLNKKDKK